MLNVNLHEECEKKEENNRELVYAENVAYNKENDNRIPLNDYKVKPNSTDDKTPSNLINEKEDSKNQREIKIIPVKQNDEIKEKNNNKKDKRIDGFFPKLCKFMTKEVNKEVKKLKQDKKFKLHPPIEEISHMCAKDQYIFLNLSFKNLYTMKLEDKFEFFRLLFELGIIVFDEEKEVNLFKKQKAKALELMRKYNYINEENTNQTDHEIKSTLIKMLKDLGYKNHNETNFKLKDKITFLKLLNEMGIVKSRHYQEKSKEIIKTLEVQGIKLLDMTFLDFLSFFFDPSKKNDQEYLNDFKQFYDDIKGIDDLFYKEKKYHLITVETGIKGYLDYVKACNKLNSDKRENLKNILEYFKGKEINVDKIKNFREFIHNVK